MSDFRRPGWPVATPSENADLAFLLIGPYDPLGGEYTFLAPPLGVWRLCGVLRRAGITAEVFDPNCCTVSPEAELERIVQSRRWDLVGISTTGMTLRYDLALGHIIARLQPNALLIAGGIEATFNPEVVFSLAPFHMIVLGEGEQPLLEIARRLRAGAPLTGLPGTASLGANHQLVRLHRAALNREQLRDSIFSIPYVDMPYPAYWERLERSYRVHELPVKAEREARLAELRSVRLITLNYCPMNCTFCSSTNFLHAAQGGITAKVGRLDAEECLEMIKRIVAAHPDVRTVIFQDDIFCFTKDKRILPLCMGIRAAKAAGDLPRDLQFISTNRIDAMNAMRLRAMREAGFRVLGFGVESFARNILVEFNKAQIHSHIKPVLETALRLGITPFLDMILTSPGCQLKDLGENIREAYRWVQAGCEVGMYPYVIPFSGAKMAQDESLRLYTEYAERQISGTSISWQQSVKILPIDPRVRGAILAIEEGFEAWLERLQAIVPHMPARVRSLLWIACAIPVLVRSGQCMPDPHRAAQVLAQHLPGLTRSEQHVLMKDLSRKVA
jgi:Fe-S oxidoreductase